MMSDESNKDWIEQSNAEWAKRQEKTKPWMHDSQRRRLQQRRENAFLVLLGIVMFWFGTLLVLLSLWGHHP